MATKRQRIRNALWLGLAVTCWVACGALIPRQGWDPAYGPVVPHDTFPTDCKLCHTGSDWHTIKAEFRYDHLKETGVELRGAHADVACLMCHNDRGPVQQFAAKGCSGCHQDPHRQQLGRECTNCHDERTWRPQGQIAMHNKTRMPLIGAHTSVACFRCHPGAQVGNFAGASPVCEHCHQQDLARATAPDHVASGFTSDCQRCHRPISWAPAEFSHPATFPLTLGHAGRRCNECHTSPGTYVGLSTACVSCHMDDYASTTVLPHATAGISTDCTQCHTTASWHGARYPHATTFPLTNGHNISCTRCHTTPGVFAGLSTACQSCHQQAYQNTTNPPHPAFNFAQTCTNCHTTVAWRPANWTHRFPRTGPHNVACFQCHTNAANRVQFSCIDCHEHNQAEMNKRHQGRPGYSWTSAACLNCHPNGRE